MKKNRQSLLQTVSYFIEKYNVILFLIILAVGLYVRFYRLESSGGFGWDQARDAWVARDILQGKWYLVGPRTGVGHFHIGPAHYYMLAPFYFLTNFDPVGSIYLNVVLNLINYSLIYFVTKKLFGSPAALFAIVIYSVSHYLIEINQTAWNVTLMPGIAALIFYGITRVYEKDYKWIYINSLFAGFYFNLHFTAIFIPIIVGN